MKRLHLQACDGSAWGDILGQRGPLSMSDIERETQFTEIDGVWC